MILFINSFAHFLVDALCVTTLFSSSAEGRILTIAIVLYNTLAFSSQCIVGLLLDKIKRCAFVDAAAMLVIVLGFALPIPFLARVCIVGAGNSVFHVAAGKMTLEASGGKAKQLGMFVAPGAFGVTLGTCFPQFGWLLSACLLICIALILKYYRGESNSQHVSAPGSTDYSIVAVILLSAAVAVRAIGGSAVGFSWKTGIGASFLLTAFVFVGKFLGGFFCDRWSAKTVAWISIPLAAVCIAFFSDYAIPSLVGQMLLNLSMPVTLWLLYMAMPDAPALAFGLAASALWPGTIAGLLIQLTGPALWCCVLISFLFGLFAVVYSARVLQTMKGGSSE